MVAPARVRRSRQIAVHADHAGSPIQTRHAARTITEWSDKQPFLNTMYERFFHGYSVKLADTMGIVYTPQPIVDFMCASVTDPNRDDDEQYIVRLAGQVVRVSVETVGIVRALPANFS